jgi:hypothetical protein
MFDTLWYAYNGYVVVYYVWNSYYAWKMIGNPLLKLVW